MILHDRVQGLFCHNSDLSLSYWHKQCLFNKKDFIVNPKEQLFHDMNYKTIGYFLSSTLIIGLLYTNHWFDRSYTFRQFLKIIFLILYFVETIFLIKRPILKNRTLRKHLLVRLSILMFIALIILISQWFTHKENDRLGAG